jgi:hypothetical protein
MAEPEWRMCPIVGGENDGDRVQCDVRYPMLNLMKRVPLELRRHFETGEVCPTDRKINQYARLELHASDGSGYRGPEMSTFLYHDPALKPWEVLRLLVEHYRG